MKVSLDYGDTFIACFNRYVKFQYQLIIACVNRHIFTRNF